MIYIFWISRLFVICWWQATIMGYILQWVGIWGGWRRRPDTGRRKGNQRRETCMLVCVSGRGWEGCSQPHSITGCNMASDNLALSPLCNRRTPAHSPLLRNHGTSTDSGRGRVPLSLHGSHSSPKSSVHHLLSFCQLPDVFPLLSSVRLRRATNVIFPKEFAWKGTRARACLSPFVHYYLSQRVFLGFFLLISLPHETFF